jgi:hypothetical protein
MAKDEKRNQCKQIARIAIILMAFSQTALAVSAGDRIAEAPPADAWTLYSQQKYAASADAFEKLIGSSTPNARLYYCAALANRGSNRNLRAKQLCQYLIAHFPGTTEAAYAKKLFPDAATATASASELCLNVLKVKTFKS